MSDPYWTVSSGVAERTGHSCRECRQVIYKGEKVTVRDGRRMRLFFHESCFSGDADPRTQSGGSVSSWGGHVSQAAPENKGHGKWSTSEYGYRGGQPASKAGHGDSNAGAGHNMSAAVAAMSGAQPSCCYICMEPVQSSPTNDNTRDSQETEQCCSAVRHEDCEWQWQLSHPEAWTLVCQPYVAEPTPQRNAWHLVPFTSGDNTSENTTTAQFYDQDGDHDDEEHEIISVEMEPCPVAHVRWVRTVQLPCAVCRQVWRSYNTEDPHFKAKAAQVFDRVGRVPVVDMDEMSTFTPLLAGLLFGLAAGGNAMGFVRTPQLPARAQAHHHDLPPINTATVVKAILIGCLPVMVFVAFVALLVIFH